jgi:hypothetical protein
MTAAAILWRIFSIIIFSTFPIRVNLFLYIKRVKWVLSVLLPEFNRNKALFALSPKFCLSYGCPRWPGNLNIGVIIDMITSD